MQNSVYYYKPGHFREYIQTITPSSILVSDALRTFRELRCLPHKFKEMVIQELSDNPQLIRELYNALRTGMQPESKFRLPYNRKAREIQLVQGLARNYKIDIEKAKAKIVIGHYDNDYQAFNYALEVAIAPTTDGDWQRRS